jgi:hypothetical protein
MAIRIEYSFTHFKPKTNFNDPIHKENYSYLKIDSAAFKKELRKSIISQFNESQGILRRVAFLITGVYFIIGVGVPVLVMIDSSMFDTLEKSDAFGTIFGILILLGFICLPLGLGYIKSRISLSEYIDSLDKYYDAHINIVKESSDYENYLEILDAGRRRPRR